MSLDKGPDTAHGEESIQAIHNVTELAKLITNCLPMVQTFADELSESWAPIEEVKVEGICATEPPIIEEPFKFGKLDFTGTREDRKVFSCSWDTLPPSDKLLHVTIKYEQFQQQYVSQSTKPREEILSVVKNVYKGLPTGHVFETHNDNQPETYPVVYFAPGDWSNYEEQRYRSGLKDNGDFGWIAPGQNANAPKCITQKHFSQALAASLFCQMHNQTLNDSFERNNSLKSCFLKIEKCTEAQDAYVNFTDGWFRVMMTKPPGSCEGQTFDNMDTTE